MSRSCVVTLDWADGKHVFRLAIDQLAELDEKTKAGPQVVSDRLRTGTWHLPDVRETLRLGLIGGGMKPLDALSYIYKYVDARPLLENVLPAYTVLQAVLVGVDVEPLGEGGGVEDELTADPHSQTVDSGSPTSTGSAAPLE